MTDLTDEQLDSIERRIPLWTVEMSEQLTIVKELRRRRAENASLSRQVERGTAELRHYVEGNGFEWQDGMTAVDNVTTAIGWLGGALETTKAELERLRGVLAEWYVDETSDDYRPSSGRAYDALFIEARWCHEQRKGERLCAAYTGCESDAVESMSAVIDAVNAMREASAGDEVARSPTLTHEEIVEAQAEHNERDRQCAVMQNEIKRAYDYAKRLFVYVSPECTPLSDLDGVLSQIDNWMCGNEAELQRLREENEAPAASTAKRFLEELPAVTDPDTIAALEDAC